MVRVAVIGYVVAQSIVLGAALEAQDLGIEHKPVGCVVAGQYPVLTTKIQPADRVARARTYFRAHDTPHWYFVEMKLEAGAYSGTLPAPKKELDRIDYYVEATDKAFVGARTADFAPRVVASASACRKDSLVAAATPAAKVFVGASPGAPAMPAGFSPSGVTALNAAGASAAAAQPTSAAVSGASAAGGSSGVSTGLIVGGVAVAGGATVAVLVATKTSGVPGPTPLPTPSCLAQAGEYFEIPLVCADINSKARVGCPMTLQFGVGRSATAAEAERVLAGTSGVITVDGVALPVTYEGITLHQGGGAADGYGNRVRAVWTPTLGTHLLTASWSIYPNDVSRCQCTVTQ